MIAPIRCTNFANILLNSDSEFMSITCVDPQPSGDCVTLLGFPTWWLSVRLRPLVILGPDAESPPFVQVCYDQQLADGFIPQVALPEAMQCVAYAPANSCRGPVDLHPDRPVPSAVEAASMIRLLPLEEPPAPTLQR